MRASVERTAADGLRSNFAAANPAGVYVARILKGEKLSDRPVCFPPSSNL
jgi:hypothetical protein